MGPRLLLLLLSLLCATAPLAQTVVLSPAVVMLAGEMGQSVTQTLTLRNESDIALDFVMEARDVLVRDGKRVVMEAGRLPGSIAATAVFSSPTLRVAPHSSGAVTATFTLPQGMTQRAVIAYFRGATLVKSGNRFARMGLGTLFTFTVSGQLSAVSAALEAIPPSASTAARLRSRLFNDGAEPLVVAGMAVILDDAGRMLGKIPFDTKRLLPGEAGTLVALYAGELPAGTYRAVATFDIGGKPLTQVSTLTVP